MLSYLHLFLFFEARPVKPFHSSTKKMNRTLWLSSHTSSLSPPPLHSPIKAYYRGKRCCAGEVIQPYNTSNTRTSASGRCSSLHWRGIVWLVMRADWGEHPCWCWWRWRWRLRMDAGVTEVYLVRHGERQMMLMLVAAIRRCGWWSRGKSGWWWGNAEDL